jgi:hypothetical protein
MSASVAIRMAGSLVIVAVLTVLWVWQCTGPEPTVTGVRLEEPQQPGDPYTVLATIDNNRWSHGTVTVLFEIVDRESGDVYRDEKRIDMKEDDPPLNVSDEISAPDSDYDPRVDVEYPPN